MLSPTPEPTFDHIQTALMELWGVINRLSQIPPPQCDRYRVSIFGSARLQPTDALYIDVKNLAQTLTTMGCDIITGGGPGLMQAANEGSVLGDPTDQQQSIGVRIALDFEQSTNPFVEQLYTHETFFSRLHQFVLLSQAFIVVPGGIGTTLETMMIWQLLQVRKLDNVPLILVGDMWGDLVTWAKQSMVEQATPQLASPADMQIPICVATMDEAIAHIRQGQAEWNTTCKI
ncbi:LOG family protein [filamentous cyanobacterium LEGE 11480]|uniref:LOG family protein n=1 Tax=Romeriopsis navalis LEGE 11480 TaxID=2777977 RepID=A0A928VMR1_9CYAN|nr:LOG family protein [Romeriopsis navalis]MBE9028814.1 LOG family protein [Romeriopsis navalis LEGE 11480]